MRNETIKRALNARFPDWQGKQFVDKQEFNFFRDELARIFEQLQYKPQIEMDNGTVASWFDMKPDIGDFLKWIGCARTWTDAIDCANLTQIESVRSRRCTTLLHRGAMVYDSVHRPELFNLTNRTADSAGYFDAKEVIKLLVDFEPEDYADLKRQIGARVVFHDNSIVAAEGDLDFFITRGYKYDFNIERKETKLMDEPYDSCLDYQAYNLGQFKTRIEPRIPLDSNSCFQNCMIRNIIHRSNCWPPTIPYYRNDSLDPNQNLKACNWFKGSHHISIFEELLRIEHHRNMTRDNKQTNSSNTFSKANRSFTNFNLDMKRMRVYKKVRRFCWSQCVLSCRIVSYSVAVTRSVWPTDVHILFDNTGEERARRHCCALVAIKFTHFHYNVQEFKPKYQLSSISGDLGGLLAVWLGLSMVSVYHAIQKLIELCSRQSRLCVHAATIAPFDN